MFQISNYEIVNALKGKVSKERSKRKEMREIKRRREGTEETRRKEVKKEKKGNGREGVVIIHEMFFKRNSRRNMTSVFIQEFL